MLNGYGWCVLRAMEPDTVDALAPDDDHQADALADTADQQLWAEFRSFMATCESPLLRWHLTDHLNNDRGVLLFHVSRNHTAPEAWSMLNWIAAHGPGSYGLFYVHDDEDEGSHRRSTGVDNSNRLPRASPAPWHGDRIGRSISG